MANQEKNPCKGYKPNGEPCPFGAKPGQMYCGKHENNHGIPAAAMVQPTNQNGSLTIENEDQSEAQELGPVEISAMAEAGTMPSDPSDMPVPAVSSEYLKRIGDISTRQKTMLAVEATVNAGHNALVWGPPGIGKTAGVKAMASERGYKFTRINMVEAHDVAKIAGYPIGMETPASAWDDNTMSPEWQEANRFQVKDMAPDWLMDLAIDREREINGENVTPTVLFIDELTAGDPQGQAALMGILAERRIGNYHIPQSTKIIAASNRAEDSDHFRGFTAAMQDRWAHFHVNTLTTDEWIMVDTDEGDVSEYETIVLGQAPHDMIKEAGVKWKWVIKGFCDLHPEFWTSDSEVYTAAKDEGYGYPTMRSYQRLRQCLAQIDHIPDSGGVRSELMEGIIGAKAATSLSSYYNSLKLPDAEEWLSKPEKAHTLTKSNGQAADDRTAAMVNMVVYAALKEPPPGKTKAWTHKRFFKALDIMTKLSQDAPDRSATRSLATGAVSRLIRSEEARQVRTDNDYSRKVMTAVEDEFDEIVTEVIELKGKMTK